MTHRLGQQFLLAAREVVVDRAARRARRLDEGGEGDPPMPRAASSPAAPMIMRFLLSDAMAIDRLTLTIIIIKLAGL
jgi:hypothetical protein